MGAGCEAADLEVWRGPRVARILEPETLNSLELFSAGKIYLDVMPVVRPASAVARTLQSIAPGLSRWEIVAIISCKERQFGDTVALA
jgi:hypothetical protein